MHVLYEDNHLLIVEKPVNMPVQSDSSGDLDLLTAAKNYIKEKYQKPGNVYLGLVHRLDRPVGGAIVFARTSKAASRLANQLRRHQIKRQYLAVVHGQVTSTNATLTDYLYKDRAKNQSYVVPSDHPQAKLAKLSYHVLQQNADYALLQVELATGRSHQIRVQLAHQGHPLYGDQKYGADVNQVGQQIALWAHSLSLIHPTTKEAISLTAQPPINAAPWQQFAKMIEAK